MACSTDVTPLEVAYEGDTVELTAFIVNGNHHNVRLVAPNGTEIKAMEMNRGGEYKLAFEASRAGIYRLVCDTHAPTMTANIIVYSRGVSHRHRAVQRMQAPALPQVGSVRIVWSFFCMLLAIWALLMTRITGLNCVISVRYSSGLAIAMLASTPEPSYLT